MSKEYFCCYYPLRDNFGDANRRKLYKTFFAFLQQLKNHYSVDSPVHLSYNRSISTISTLCVYFIAVRDINNSNSYNIFANRIDF